MTGLDPWPAFFLHLAFLIILLSLDPLFLLTLSSSFLARLASNTFFLDSQVYG